VHRAGRRLLDGGWNLGAFCVMPLIGVAYAIKITLFGR